MIKVANIQISKNQKPFIIAEMSGNHNQSLNRALEIVDAAAAAGAHAIKLQTYTADTITIDKKEGEFLISDPKSLWKGETLYELYKKAYTPWEWHEPIFKRAKEKGILCFSSPFDFTAVDFLETLDAPAYKIASFENIDIPLIRKVAKTGKPIIISTGMANVQEIAEAVDAVRSEGNDQLILLKCTSTYPATPDNTNIVTIPHMKDLFQCEVGLSDHTLGIGVAIASVALGATVIEKHFTLSRVEGGVDSTFSMEPDEMKALVIETERAWQALGRISYDATEKEKASLVFRRSLYVVEDMKKGDLIFEKNVRSIRPGYGLPPKYLEIVLGKRVNQDLKRGTALKWELLD
ncbi:pseudaminic acid synthase [Leptospira noguchii]|uniref:pseudaminic acid synthase n=1 Tax=Leptospira noguchii TaxID=28182 RepID=UPI001F056D73|nr:pseudaminic acid synthase [Leptospira noguchii]MCH1913321.1 pseudaminic acid synthase [Leptospira noguchii]MCH1915416.1 pseudaminic acid synthase [Leptospira noguchii]UOG65265.1 pseudaminic acid synthase [Leptospira noguchii]